MHTSFGVCVCPTVGYIFCENVVATPLMSHHASARFIGVCCFIFQIACVTFLPVMSLQAIVTMTPTAALPVTSL